MAINLDAALGIHPQALDVRVERSKLIAGNLANSETPGFKAQDLDFKAIMTKVDMGMNVDRNYQAMYRMPHQTSADNNTVELNKEQARFAQNAMDYQTSLTFLNLKISGLKTAIEGQ